MCVSGKVGCLQSFLGDNGWNETRQTEWHAFCGAPLGGREMYVAAAAAAAACDGGGERRRHVTVAVAAGGGIVATVRL